MKRSFAFFLAVLYLAFTGGAMANVLCSNAPVCVTHHATDADFDLTADDAGSCESHVSTCTLHKVVSHIAASKIKVQRSGDFHGSLPGFTCFSNAFYPTQKPIIVIKPLLYSTSIFIKNCVFRL